MTNATITLLGLVGWQMLVLFMLASVRVTTSFSIDKAVNTFSPDGSDLSEFGYRVTRVHANGYENIPLFIGVILFAMITGQQNIIEGTALILLGARIIQGLTHLISTSELAVQLRFAFFLIQVGIILYWLYGFLMA